MMRSLRPYFVITTIVLSIMSGYTEGSRAKFLVTVPSSPSYDHQYTATVTAYDVEGPESVELLYKSHTDTSRILNKTILNFKEDGVKTWTVTFPWDQMEKLEVNGLILVVQTLWVDSQKTLLFNKDNGYIFIQTDKPIYTPRQTVKFRLLAIDEYQRLANYTLKVDIRNDKMIVVERLRLSPSEAFKAQEFQLPKETPPGIWTITANYEGLNHVESNAKSVTFEVKEYVLPRFSAAVKISKDVITKATNWITITVSAKYVYGYYAMGTLEMQLGVWDPQMGIHLLPHKYLANLTRGEYKVDIRVKDLIAIENITSPSKRLYVAVNVTEDGTGENHTVVDTSTFIAHPFYEITHTDSKTHFKPGFPYTLHCQVRAKSGRPASWVLLHMAAHYINKHGRRIGGSSSYGELNKAGKLSHDFNITADTDSVKIKSTVVDLAAGRNNDRELTVPILPSKNRQYLHTALEKHITKYSDGLLRLRYTAPAPSYRKQKISIQVLSKGQIVFAENSTRNKNGVSVVKLPMALYNMVSPSMRVVASFYHTDGHTPEFVVDSLNVDTEDVCVEELRLHKPGGVFASPLPKEPKEKYNLKISGGPFMDVGMVAVDEAVFLLSDKHTLTRKSMFQQLGSHDQGKGNGDGVGLAQVMKNSGLAHVFISNEEEASWSHRANQGAKGPFSNRYFPQARKVVSGPNGTGAFVLHTPDDRIRESFHHTDFHDNRPPQTARQYFPESWLFNEVRLPKSGRKTLDLTLPDSITTWSFMAVGLSATHGVCVSEPLQQRVQKKFFVDIRMPYKATRLEEIKVKVAIYNYHTEPIKIDVKVTGSQGLCFSANRYRGTEQNGTSFSLRIGKQRAKSRDIKVIPLENGELTLQVDAYNPSARDIVEKKLYVVAEGVRMRKSLTFVLDPEAKHATFSSKRRRKIMLSDTATMKNTVDLRRKIQKTEIDLAMPKEVIRGTENCRISAFGDLMGDIITHAVVKSKSLTDQAVMNAQEVLADLGPTVYALLYANHSGLMDETLAARARKFVSHGVARLLRYRKDQAFSLTPESAESTWLTTSVLKTLCRSSKLAYIDKDILIDHGFYWLLRQVNENGTLKEEDWTLSRTNSTEYQIMLSAEVLITLMECERQGQEEIDHLMYEMSFYLEDNVADIQEPMVLAKVAYALTLYEAYLDTFTMEGGEGEGVDEEYAILEVPDYVQEEVEEYPDPEATQQPEPKKSEQAVMRLTEMARRNPQGQIYWSSTNVTDEDRTVPFWYRKGVKASAIEATAFSLLVFLTKPGANVDAIADWLVAQRNQHGSFIGDRDSMAAIQALSAYSLQKTHVAVDLSCNVTSDKKRHYTHSFKFTQRNAIQPESLNNVPVGHSLEVMTKGQGLGQMQVNVEYNVPIDPNENCDFNVTVDVKRTELNFFPDMHHDPLCVSCGWWCRPLVDESNTTGNCTSNNSTSTGNETSSNCTDSSDGTTTPSKTTTIQTTPPPPLHPKGFGVKMSVESSSPGISVSMGKPSVKSDFFGTWRQTRRNSGRRSRPRSRRSAERSYSSICIKVCLRHVNVGTAGQTRLEVDMLTGYRPVDSDIKNMKQMPHVMDAVYVMDSDKVVVYLDEVSDDYQTCVGFRAVDHDEVGRPTPANVLVTEVGNPAPSCSLEYHSPSKRESLQVYCADFSNTNRGECRCYSGICSNCSPSMGMEDMSFIETKELVCNSDVGYQVEVKTMTDRDQWAEIEAKVLSVNKTGSHKLSANDTIHMISPASCRCPTFFSRQRRGPGSLYMISTDVEKMIDRYGNVVHHYLLDEQSSFVVVSEPNTSARTSSRPTVPHIFLNRAFKDCPK